MEVETESAYKIVRRVARKAGLLDGISAAAAASACLGIAREEAAAGRSTVVCASRLG
jgi:cysteine synthase